MKRLFVAVLGAAIGLSVASADAADKIRIGIIAHLSGPFADSGKQFTDGINTFLAQHGTSVGGRDVELIYRDVGGANPQVARRLAEELVIKDKVQLLGGFYLSPDASAVASVITEAKIPSVIFNAASPAIMRQSPWFVRTGQSLWQASTPPAEWAIAQGKKTAYLAVADYAPGYDVEDAFKTKFTALGGQIVGDDRIPLNTIDFSAFAERIARAKPAIVVSFIPNGAPSAGFIKALAAQGVMSGGTPVIGSAETDDTEQKYFDDNVVGAYSSLFYVPSLDNPENKAFKAQLAKTAGPDVIPNFAMVGAYDGMNVLYHMIEAQAGKPFDPNAAMAAAKGYEWKSPRGPAKIEPDTRDITQNEYIRQVQKVDGKRINVVVATYPMVKDPWPAAHPN